jgi:hypothetical protein
VSARRYRVVYDEDVRQVVASLPAAGKRAVAALFRELIGDALLLERLGAGPAEQEVAYASGRDLLVAYRVDHTERTIEVLSLVWLGAT